MDTRLLEYFVTVAAESSVTAAAGELFAAQSTVSAGLRSLERSLAVTLFDRSEHRLRLTPAGEALLPIALETLAAMERLTLASGQAKTSLAGRLRIGVFTAMDLSSGLPGALAAFRREFPNISVRLTASGEGSTGLADDLAHGRLDVAFFALRSSEDLDVIDLASFPYIALVPPEHPLAARATTKRPEVTLAELSASEWVDVPAGFGNRAQVERALAARGLARTIAAEVVGLPMLTAYVASGVGVAVVPDVVDTSGCAVLRIADELPAWTLSIALRPGGRDRPPIARFTELLRASSFGRSDASGRGAGS